MPAPRHRRPVALAALAISWLAGISPGFAGDENRPRAVVELFTSEGCSSCPPADAVMARIAQSPGIVALTYHVDYWDYLGWRDTLATPANTERQKSYAGVMGNSVYTPEAIVNGRVDVVGSREEAVREAIAEFSRSDGGLAVRVSLSRTPDSVVIDVGKGGPAACQADVLLVSFLPDRRVPIHRGENKGATIRYVNSVTRLQPVGMWHGDASRFEIPLAPGAEEGLAVLVQANSRRKAGGPGAILGAAVLPPAESQ